MCGAYTILNYNNTHCMQISIFINKYYIDEYVYALPYKIIIFNSK